MPGCKKRSSLLQPAQAGHAMLLLNKTLTFIEELELYCELKISSIWYGTCTTLQCGKMSNSTPLGRNFLLLIWSFPRGIALCSPPLSLRRDTGDNTAIMETREVSIWKYNFYLCRALSVSWSFLWACLVSWWEHNIGNIGRFAFTNQGKLLDRVTVKYDNGELACARRPKNDNFYLRRNRRV